MNGRAFLGPAEDLAAGPGEAHRRSAAGRAYYAIFQEAFASLKRWGFRVPPRENVHAYVRLRFAYSSDPDARRIGDTLDNLSRLRNMADYQLAEVDAFRTSKAAYQAINDSRSAIALLDAIEADPDRRAGVVGTILP